MCPTTKIKVQDKDTSPVFEDNLPDSEDGKPRSKVQKEAVNEAIKRAHYLHVPHAEADNPALMEKHEEIEKQNAIHLANLVAMKHVKHNLMGTNWKALQEADPIISHVLKWKKMNESNRTKDKNHRDRRTLEEYLLTVINAFDAKAYGLRQKGSGVSEWIVVCEENCHKYHRRSAVVHSINQQASSHLGSMSSRCRTPRV